MILLISTLYSCKSHPDDKLLEIYHLIPDEIIEQKENGDWYSKERNDFFAVRNFDLNNEEHKMKVDSFVLDYISKDDFLVKNENASWSLVFFNYGDGITEHTKHEFDSDYTIHDLFAFNKRLIYYSFDTKDYYKITGYYLKDRDTITQERRKMIEEHFKNAGK
ncbi:MAG: hypothetical protein NTU44_07505 [Bacteroidetes bacterium]|nr:hypothetical protein [Bacteroidota bacterium]